MTEGASGRAKDLFPPQLTRFEVYTADVKNFPGLAAGAGSNDQIADDDVVGEVIIGFDRLRRMSHTELRDVIGGRVALLENEFRGREERRAAIDTANSASQILDFRRERAKRIHRQVNRGSAIAAIASTFLLVAIMV